MDNNTNTNNNSEIRLKKQLLGNEILFGVFGSIITSVITIPLAILLLGNFTEPIPQELNLVLLPVLAIAGIVVLRFLLKNSMFFKTSMNIIIIAAIAALTPILIQILGGSLLTLAVVGPGVFVLVITFVIQTINQTRRPVNILRENMLLLSEGKLSDQKLDIRRFSKEFAELEDAYLKATTNQIKIIEDIQQIAQQVASGAEEFASSSEEVNASIEEISTIIQQMNHGAQTQAEQINDTVEKVNTLSETANRLTLDITKAVGIITEVANQTNILALNAAIEAARAGDYGRGFAVVADNVRRLAEDTKQNSIAIGQLIKNIKTEISTAVQNIASAIDSVASISEETASGSEEASAATEEQTASIEEMSTGAQDLSLSSQNLVESIRKFEIIHIDDSPIKQATKLIPDRQPIVHDKSSIVKTET